MSKSRFNTPRHSNSKWHDIGLVICALTFAGLFILSILIGASL